MINTQKAVPTYTKTDSQNKVDPFYIAPFLIIRV